MKRRKKFIEIESTIGWDGSVRVKIKTAEVEKCLRSFLVRIHMDLGFTRSFGGVHGFIGVAEEFAQ